MLLYMCTCTVQYRWQVLFSVFRTGGADVVFFPRMVYVQAIMQLLVYGDFWAGVEVTCRDSVQRD